jgi:hypothetical protein
MRRTALLLAGASLLFIAAAHQFQRGLVWAGGILAGAGLVAGIGIYVWRCRLRRNRRRANPMVCLLMYPTAYSVPPEPPVPESLPHPETDVQLKMRSAA